MAKQTNIQWADSTLNLQMGCGGCELWNPSKGVKRCYAGLMTERMLRAGPLKGWPERFEKPKVFPERVAEAERWLPLFGQRRPDKPWLDFAPRMVFLNDMGDTFADGMPDGWFEPLMEKLARTPHVYILLTKRPTRMRDYFRTRKVPDNFIVGTSITSLQPARLDALCEIDAKIKCVSYEPAWRFADLRPWFKRGLNWVKLGGESGGPEAMQQDLQTLRNLKDLCVMEGVACFVKQLGSKPIDTVAHHFVPVFLKDSHGGDWDEWPEDLKLRQIPVARVQQSELCIG